MRGCDVCGRPPKWLWCGPYEKSVAVFCGFHARGYLHCVGIPSSWLRPLEVEEMRRARREAYGQV